MDLGKESGNIQHWLGGYESILNRMTPGNFDWFIHVMLFVHTMHVISIQQAKASREDNHQIETEDDGYSADNE